MRILKASFLNLGFEYWF